MIRGHNKSFNTSSLIPAAVKLSKNEGSENSPTIFPPMCGNEALAAPKTPAPPLPPGDVAINNIGLLFQTF